MADSYCSPKVLDDFVTALKAATPGDEVVLFSTVPASGQRQSCPHLQGAYVSILSNVPLTIYHRHLPLRGSSWREAVFVDAGVEDQDGVPLDVDVVNELLANFFGDDHEFVVKAALGGSAPTTLEASIRFTDHP